MRSLMSRLVFYYTFCIHMKYWGRVFRSIDQTVSAGYDENTRRQRADETLGLGLLEEATSREMFYRTYRPHSGWDFEVSAQLAIQATGLLSDAGWNKDRIIRKHDQLMEQLGKANPVKSPV